MRHDALQLIQDTAVKADGKRLFETKNEPDGVYFMARPDGTLEKREGGRAWHKHTVADFESVAKRVAIAYHLNPAGPTVWYSQCGIVAVLSENGRDTAQMPLALSEPYAELVKWARTKAYQNLNPREIYHAFRTTFADAFKEHPDIKKQVSKVDFQKMQKANSEFSTGKVSVDRSMMAESTGATGLPEILTFTVPFFAQTVAPFEVKIRTAFDLDPENEKFRFYVLPGEIERSIMDAEDYLQGRILKALRQLRGDGGEEGGELAEGEIATVQGLDELVPVYRGTP